MVAVDERFWNSAVPISGVDRRIYSLCSLIGGLSTSIKIYDRMLSGKRPIGKSALAMAAYEGRDYLAEIAERRRVCIVKRYEAACALEAEGYAPKKIREYRARAADPTRTGSVSYG